MTWEGERLARLSIRLVSNSARSAAVGLVVLGLLLLGAASVATAATPQQDLARANASVQRALAAARAGDLTTAKQAYDEYETAWFDVEDGVRTMSRDAYVAIEKAMTGVATSFAAAPPNADKVATALAALDREQQAFIGGQTGGQAQTAGPATDSAAQQQPSIAGLIAILGDAQAALARNDYATTQVELKEFQAIWPSVEGEVKARSAEDYRQTEIDMAQAETLAGQRSPQVGGVVDRMASRLEPYAQPQRYGIFDAAIILLREGLEALLVLVALSAFLKKSGNVAAQGWLWTGASGGLVLSLALGLAVQAFFGAIINPGNREIMEGAIGLTAAAMLIYVSYWLHSKASLGGWQNYIRERTSQALGGGKLFGLAVLAFLAVFREGAETALFYLGMASNIAQSDLFIGLALGFVGLAALGFLMIVVGVKIPMRPFFAVASVLVFYLCFKFVGMGIHALQVANVLPSGSAGYLPSLDAIGLYPTWPTTIAQALLLGAGLWVVVRDRLADAARERPRVFAPR